MPSTGFSGSSEKVRPEQCDVSHDIMSDVWCCALSHRGSKEAVLGSHHGLQQRSAGHCGTGELRHSTIIYVQENACRLFKRYSGHRWAHICHYLCMNHFKFRSIYSPCNNTLVQFTESQINVKSICCANKLLVQMVPLKTMNNTLYIGPSTHSFMRLVYFCWQQPLTSTLS